MGCRAVFGSIDDAETASRVIRIPTRLWLCTQPTDMRRSYDGLTAIVRSQFAADPLSGDGFVFINRRRTQLKCVYFEAGGYCIFSKRLERGLFAQRPEVDVGRVRLSQTEVTALIEGFEVIITQ